MLPIVTAESDLFVYIVSESYEPMGGQLTVVFLVHAISVRVLCKAQYIWLICGSNVELANKSGRH